MSLTKKLVFTFLLAVLIPIEVIIWVARQTLVEQAQQQIGSGLEDSVVQVGKSMDDFMFNAIRHIQTIASDQDMSSQDLPQADRDLVRSVDAFSYFDEAMLVNPRGVIIASSDSSSVGLSLFARFAKTRNEFELALRGRPGSVYVSDLGSDLKSLGLAAADERLSNRLLDIQILVSVQDSEGRPVGVIVANVLTRQLLWLLRNLKQQAPGDEYPYLLDQAGLVLMSADPHVRLFSTPTDATGGALRVAMAGPKNGHLVYTNFRGQKLMAGYAGLATYGDNNAGGWWLISPVSYQTIMKPADESFNRMMGILLATLLAAGVLGVLVSHHLVEPLLKLTKGAKTIAAGNYDTRVVATTHDEIGVLANTFNQMADALETRAAERSQAQEALSRANAELEQRVGERTTELVAEISQHKKAQEGLTSSERKFRTLFEAANDAIFILHNGLFVDCNARGADLFGVPMDQVIGRSPLHFMPAIQPEGRDSQEKVRETMELVLVGEPHCGEWVHLHSNGTPVYTDVSINKLELGSEVYIQAVVRDITERKRAEQTLRESEERFRDLFENASDLIQSVDMDGRFVFVNPAWKQALGYTEEDLKGLRLFDIVDPALLEKAAQRFERLIAGEKLSDFETTFVAKDGHRIVLEGSAHCQLRDGKPIGKRSIFRNVTARRALEEKLNVQSAALEAAANAIVITSRDGTIQWTNPAFTQLTGYEASEVIGANPRLLKSGVEPVEFYKDLWGTISSGKVWHGEVVNRRKDGTHYTEEMTIAPVRAADGAIDHFVAIKQDITMRKEVETELLESKEAAEAATRAKSEFLANMSHEIRTPMNGVVGMTELLLDTKLTDEQCDFAETIRASADSLLAIINDILDFSKIEAGKLTMDTIEFDLCKAVEGAMETFAARADAKGIELANFLEPDVMGQLRGDPGRLQQILTNLLGNAVKFTEHGEVVVIVSKQSESLTDIMLRFEVTDTGVGIEEEAQARIFQSFSQADGSTTRKYGGTGLGLAISKQLVSLMGGEIGVNSTPGYGATFWFTARFEKQIGMGVLAAPGAHGLVGLRVLIVDDNATNRKILRHQLEAWRITADSVAGGSEALKELRRAVPTGGYDLAILDMQMPEMDGIMLARAIKADTAIAATRLVILTSLGQMLDAAGLKTAGVDACLVKPVKQSRLLDCMVSIVTGAAPRLPEGIGASVPELLRPARILLAEDNPVNQLVAIGQLKKLGYSADAVTNGLGVIAALRRTPYDIILMDCQMPEMDGYETTRRIRSTRTDSTRPYIIAMTAHAMHGDSEKCLAAGMNAYISKPVQLTALAATLARACPATVEIPASDAAKKSFLTADKKQFL